MLKLLIILLFVDRWKLVLVERFFYCCLKFLRDTVKYEGYYYNLYKNIDFLYKRFIMLNFISLKLFKINFNFMEDIINLFNSIKFN